ncbi:MAG: flagellar hook-length control protein FliK [Pseudomonadota bacterium]
MQQGLIQALMNVLPTSAASLSPSVMQGDGTVDFAAFLQSMAPALEQQLETLPAEVRAGLLAELGQEIRNAQAVAEVNSPEAKALDAMLQPAAAPSAEDADKDEPMSLLDQLLGMLGEKATLTVPAGETAAPVVEGTAEGVQDSGALPSAADSSVDMAALLPAWAALAPESAKSGDVAMPATPANPAAARVMAQAQVQAQSSREGERQPHAAGAQPAVMASQDGAADKAAARDAFLSMLASDMDRQASPANPAAVSMAREVAQAMRAGETLNPTDNNTAEAGLAPSVALASEPPRPRQDLQVLDRIPVPPGPTREFGEAVGQRVMLMVGREMQGARIELNPVDLGPMEINLQLRGNEATVHFGAAHALTREAIEAAIPRLRDLLAEQGYTQVNVNVGQQQGQNAQAFNQSGQGNAQGWTGAQQAMGQGADNVDTTVHSIEYPARAGGVDLFA